MNAPPAPPPRAPGRALPALSAAAILLYGLVAARHLGGLRWDSDEGINHAKGRLLGESWLGGERARLYREIWSDQPPGYTSLTALPLALHPDLASARGVTVALALAALAAAAIGARELALGLGMTPARAHLASLAAVPLLAAAPNFWWASRAAMIGLPAFALGALAMAFCLARLRTGRARWTAASAAALGLSLWLKLQMAYLGPLIALLVALDVARARNGPDRARRLAREWGALIALGLGPLALAALVAGPAAFWDQVFGSYLGTRQAYAVDLAANGRTLWTWLAADNLGLAALAAAGLLALLSRRSPQSRLLALACLLWVASGVAAPMQHAPLWIKDHFQPLLLSLAPLAGLGGVAALGRGSALGRPARWAALAALALYAARLPAVLRVDAALASARSYDNDGQVVAPGDDAWRSQERKDDDLRAAAAWLATASGPADRVLTDYQLVATVAGRRPPAAVAAFSSRAVAVGAFTDAGLTRLAADPRVAAAVLWDEGIQAFPGLVGWLEGACGPAVDLGSERRGFACRPPAVGAAAPLGRFAGVALLLGEAHGWRGGALELRLFWQALSRTDAPLSVSVHLLDGAGARRAQHDGTPAEGGQPTTEWAPGGLVVDRHELVPEAGARGPFVARIGLYSPADGRRLPSGGADHVDVPVGAPE